MAHFFLYFPTVNARCEVINHNPICSCPSNMTGDAFIRCTPIPKADPETPKQPINPCYPSPCGSFAECRAIGETPSCSCLPNYFGAPPNCRPECVVNTDCPSDKSCIAEKCRNPCEGSCGWNAECRVQNHIPICQCRTGFTGDPFTQCSEVQIIRDPIVTSPCDPSPCGSNADCNDGVCTCRRNYFGDPYSGCRPECTMNSDCAPQKTCINNRCVDPCPGTCGENARCDVSNHIPSCSCPPGYTGDAFVFCRKEEQVQKDPCGFCGQNAVCRISQNGVPGCSCLPGMMGSPPSCRPECLSSGDCPLEQACLNQKCVDPCPGTCGSKCSFEWFVLRDSIERTDCDNKC